MINCNYHCCIDDVDDDAVICCKTKQMEFAMFIEIKDTAEVENDKSNRAKNFDG